MAILVSIKFNDAEAEVLQRAHAASGTVGLSSHIKLVYFDALKLNVGVLQDIRSDLERISASVEHVHAQGEGNAESGMRLSLLCGLYLMVRKSVGEGVRAQADQFVDASAVEDFLRGR